MNEAHFIANYLQIHHYALSSIDQYAILLQHPTSRVYLCLGAHQNLTDGINKVREHYPDWEVHLAVLTEKAKVISY